MINQENKENSRALRKKRSFLESKQTTGVFKLLRSLENWVRRENVRQKRPRSALTTKKMKLYRKFDVQTMPKSYFKKNKRKKKAFRERKKCTAH